MNIKKLLLIFTVLILAFFVKNIFYQYKNFSKAENSYKNGEFIQAIDYYERVILAYTPFSKIVNESVKNLKNICVNTDDSFIKLYCYETLKSSLFQIRSFYQPYRDDLNFAINQSAIIKAHNDANFTKEYLSLDKFNRTPNTFWSLLSILSFLGIIIFLYYLIQKNRINLISLGFILILTVIWLISLYMA